MSVQKLQHRLSSLENSINQDGVAPNSSGGISLAQQVDQLAAQVEALHGDKFKDFYDKYKLLAPMLNNDVELKEMLISSDMKESILLSGHEDFLKTANMLESMGKLSPVLDKPPVADLAELEKQLDAAEASMAVKVDAVAALHQDVEAFLQHYNDIINLMSQKFLLYDAAAKVL